MENLKPYDSSFVHIFLKRFRNLRETGPRGPFLERPGKLTGPVSYFEIEVSREVESVLTSNEVHFVSLPENFTV